MYKPNSSIHQESSDSLESKYTVAEILSSMTSGQPPLTPVSFASGIAPAFPCSSGSVLTPTTLANLEQTFSDLSNQQQQGDLSFNAESGFVPPVVNPIVIDPANINQMGIKREYDPSWDDEMSNTSSQEPDWNGPSGSKRFYRDPMANSSLVPKIDPNTYLVANSRRPTGPRKERDTANMSTEEVVKKSHRRERNKEAAAKCRQRRVDQTNVLINETEDLEEEKSQLETEIQSLQQQKEQLEFLLNAHKPMCKIAKCTHSPHSHAQHTMTSQQLPISSAYMQTSQPAMTTPRPSSLALRTTQAPSSSTMVSSVAGVPITTPSGVFANISLDTIMEGHTGLTPLTTQPPTCSTQVQLHRTSSGDSSSEMGSPNSNLISL